MPGRRIRFGFDKSLFGSRKRPHSNYGLPPQAQAPKRAAGDPLQEYDKYSEKGLEKSPGDEKGLGRLHTIACGSCGSTLVNLVPLIFPHLNIDKKMNQHGNKIINRMWLRQKPRG